MKSTLAATIHPLRQLALALMFALSIAVVATDANASERARFDCYDTTDFVEVENQGVYGNRKVEAQIVLTMGQQQPLSLSPGERLESATSSHSTVIFKVSSREPKERIRGLQRIASLSLENRQSA